MVKKAKNQGKELTGEDKEILEHVFLRYVTKFYALTQKYPDAKQYAKKKILKVIQSDKDIAALHLITYMKNEPSTHLFKPLATNRRFENSVREAIQQDYKNMIGGSEDIGSHQKFLHPRDLRTNVFKKLETYGILLHIEGKKEIRRNQYGVHRPGKSPSSIEVKDEGRPSAYKVSKEVAKLKKAMEKQGALDFLYDKIMRSGLAHKLAEFNILGFLYAAKMDIRALYRMMGVGVSYFNDNTISKKNTDSLKVLVQQLQEMDDQQLRQYADYIAKAAIEDRGYYMFLFMVGLLRL
jgi:hypothetical protein